MDRTFEKYAFKKKPSSFHLFSDPVPGFQDTFSWEGLILQGKMQVLLPLFQFSFIQLDSPFEVKVDSVEESLGPVLRVDIIEHPSICSVAGTFHPEVYGLGHLVSVDRVFGIVITSTLETAEDLHACMGEIVPF